VVGGQVITALAYASLPRLAEQVARGEWTAFRRQLARLMLIGFVLGACGVAACAVIGAWALELAYSPEVAVHTDVLVWMAVNSTVLWTYLFLGTALDAMRRFNIQPYIFATSSLGILIAARLLVPDHGMLGASWSMGIGFVIDAILFFAAVGIPLLRAREGEGL
jgi:O-antigen/teichoic acid export membrane protein